MFHLSEYRDFVLYAGYALAGLATFLFTHMLMSEQENMSAQENLRELDGKKTKNQLIRLTRPFFSNYILPSVRGKKSLEEWRTKYRRKVVSAGIKDEITADEFIAFKILLIVFFPIVAGLLKAGGFLDADPWVFMVLPVVGFFYPDLWVDSIIKVRHQQVLKSLPFVVDLLALSTEAGLDFIGAIQKVVEKASPSPFIDELSQVLKEIKVGSSRGEALREMSQRINMQEVNSFVAVLVSADQMGASIGKVLRQQSDQIRTLRFVRAEKMGATAVQKLFIPTFALILPAIGAILFGPFILQAMLGGGAP
jgi:tight adherence protein C